jgi:hypothetical protein
MSDRIGSGRIKLTRRLTSIIDTPIRDRDCGSISISYLPYAISQGRENGTEVEV